MSFKGSSDLGKGLVDWKLFSLLEDLKVFGRETVVVERVNLGEIEKGGSGSVSGHLLENNCFLRIWCHECNFILREKLFDLEFG